MFLHCYVTRDFRYKFRIYRQSKSSTMFPICLNNADNCKKVVPLSKDKKVVGVGAAGLDFVAVVAKFPEPDQKIRTREYTVEGGGNAANTMTCLRRLGINSVLVTKIGSDFAGQSILEELKREDMDTSYIIRQEGANSPFTYVLVDASTSTRTCIHTPSDAQLASEEVNLDCLCDASLVHLDGRHPLAALKVCIPFCLL